MAEKLPTIELIVQWLKYLLRNRDTVVVFSHHMNTHVPQWVKKNYGRQHNAETYARKWRRLRSDQRVRLSRANLVVVEVPPKLNPKTNESAWQIQKANTNGSNSRQAPSSSAAKAST